MTSFTLEQKEISKSVQMGLNVIVRAVAGSGKTTTCKCIIEDNPSLKTCVVLFNRELADETKHKFKDLDNVNVSTLHALVSRLYGFNTSSDEGLYQLLNSEKTVENRYDLIICDEAQDYSELNIKVIQRLLKDLEISQVVMMGDEHQCIYQFREANPDYLISADSYLFPKNNKWVNLSLTKTFRCPRNICNFVNSTLGMKVMPHFEGGQVEYQTINMFDERNVNFTAAYIIQEVEKFLKQGNYISDVAILSYSLKLENSPMSSIVNQISKRGWPIYIPQEDQEINSKLMKGKIVFSTFHSFKGRERKIIFLLGIDKFLENYLKTNELKNVLYVAMTRATQKLYLIQNASNSCLDVFKDCPNAFYIQNSIIPSRAEKVYHVTGMIKHLPYKLTQELLNLIEIETLAEPSSKPIVRVQQFDHLYEDVSNICGELVLYFKRYLLDPEAIHAEIFSNFESIMEDKKKKIFATYISDCEYGYYHEDEKILKYLSNYINILNCVRQNVIYPLKQIKHYDWIPSRKIFKVMEHLRDIKKGALFEYPYIYRINDLHFIIGRADIIQKDVIYEIKFTKSLNYGNIFQLIMYIILDFYQTKKLKTGILINLMTGEKVKVEISVENIFVFFNLILLHKKIPLDL